jgi:hypothetical protein
MPVIAAKHTLLFAAGMALGITLPRITLSDIQFHKFTPVQSEKLPAPARVGAEFQRQFTSLVASWVLRRLFSALLRDLSTIGISPFATRPCLPQEGCGEGGLRLVPDA